MSNENQLPRTGKRLQVPVTAILAKDIEMLAQEIDVSVSRLGQRLIEESLKDKDGFGSWLLRRVYGPGTERKKMGWRQLGGDSEVKLQITVWEATSKEMELIASRLNHTTVRFAALLLDFGLDRIGPGIKKWNTWPLAKLYDILPIPSVEDPEKSADSIELIY